MTAGRMGGMAADSIGGTTSNNGFLAGLSVGLSQSCCCWPLTKVQRQVAFAVPNAASAKATPRATSLYRRRCVVRVRFIGSPALLATWRARQASDAAQQDR